MSRPVLRFAPSPNGELHLGHALSALFGFDTAERLGGRFLLRIEDIDLGRCRDEFIVGIYEDLAWLGLRWEEPVLRQSEHFSEYLAAAQRLEAMGVLYPCFATRKEIAGAAARQDGEVQRDPDGAVLYPGLHRNLAQEEVAQRKAQGETAAMRLDIARAAELAIRRIGGPIEFTELGEDGAPRRVRCRPERWGDAVIVRKDWPASYHLAVVVDDARQGITHVTRGQDLLAATDLHRVLQVLLGLPEPVYLHHRLICDGEGRKLAKSARDTSLASLRKAGARVQDIREMVGLGRARPMEP